MLVERQRAAAAAAAEAAVDAPALAVRMSVGRWAASAPLASSLERAEIGPVVVLVALAVASVVAAVAFVVAAAADYDYYYFDSVVIVEFAEYSC